MDAVFVVGRSHQVRTNNHGGSTCSRTSALLLDEDDDEDDCCSVLRQAANQSARSGALLLLSPGQPLRSRTHPRIEKATQGPSLANNRIRDRNLRNSSSLPYLPLNRTSLPSPLFLFLIPASSPMESVSNRLKTLGFSRRKNSVHNFQNTNNLAPTTNGTTPTPPPNSSQTSLPPMNLQPNPAGSPPSYSFNNVAARPTSPLPPGHTHIAHHPPPIDTTQRLATSTPTMAPPQPPGYGGYAPHTQQVAPHGINQYTRPAEVDGGGRSKAQLIVGIDFVRSDAPVRLIRFY